MKDSINLEILLLEISLSALEISKLDENKTRGESAAIHVQISNEQHTMETLKRIKNEN